MAATAQEQAIEAYVDKVIRRYKTTTILYYPYASGAVDTYKQRTRDFGTPVELVGRAILNPTEEQLSMIGNDERYDIAFLFSRPEMEAKFPSVAEGEWVDVTGEMTWWQRRFRIVKVHPTGQVGERFLLVVMLAKTIERARD